jgi:DNA-binding MarR family transcriptional regulator
MDFYQSLGYLILGSRMRRFGDYFLQEINQVYENENIPFEASWFPLFYILKERGSASIKEISDRTQVSHSAVSQLVSNLKKKGLVESETAQMDGRKQLICLTDKGIELLKEIEPVWECLLNVMHKLEAHNPAIGKVLEGMKELEETFHDKTLSDSIQKELNLSLKCIE